MHIRSRVTMEGGRGGGCKRPQIFFFRVLEVRRWIVFVCEKAWADAAAESLADRFLYDCH